jgi:hypothetical protein
MSASAQPGKPLGRRLTIGLLFALAVTFTACARTDEAQDPVWGKEPCAHCAMLVGDKLHAGQVVAGGDRRYFDDLGCMVQWLAEHGGKAEKVWARDPEGLRWVDAKSATYGDGAKTPMDFGFETRAPGISWDELGVRITQKKRSGG